MNDKQTQLPQEHFDIIMDALKKHRRAFLQFYVRGYYYLTQVRDGPLLQEQRQRHKRQQERYKETMLDFERQDDQQRAVYLYTGPLFSSRYILRPLDISTRTPKLKGTFIANLPKPSIAFTKHWAIAIQGWCYEVTKDPQETSGYNVKITREDEWVREESLRRRCKLKRTFLGHMRKNYTPDELERIARAVWTQGLSGEYTWRDKNCQMFVNILLQLIIGPHTHVDLPLHFNQWARNKCFQFENFYINGLYYVDQILEAMRQDEVLPAENSLKSITTNYFRVYLSVLGAVVSLEVQVLFFPISIIRLGYMVVFTVLMRNHRKPKAEETYINVWRHLQEEELDIA